MSSEIEILDSAEHVLIKLKGSMHLFIEWNKLVAIQSYQGHDDKFYIDYYFQGADPVICEYTESIWKDMLSKLEAMLWRD